MSYKNNRISWDTNIKHYVRFGLYNNLPEEIKTQIPRTNIHRWANETDDKYFGCEVAKFIKEELELIKQTGQSRNAKKVLETYFKLSQIYHSITGKTKALRNAITRNKEKIVETIEHFKPFVSINDTLKIFNISRATYQNYKTLVLNKCSSSYFEWCVKRYPHQLLKTEVFKIKSYFENKNYQFWSKASLYYLGLRNNDFSFGLSTFYKYSKLLGFKSGRHIYNKPKYKPLISSKPNQIWCADVTIFKTADGVRYYIHFLIDHYSKMVLGYQVANSSQPKIIKSLLQKAFEKYPNSETINFLTDGGIENVNKMVQNFVLSSGHKIIHTVAQRDIPESNSTIEAFNKVIKNQFLRPRNLENGIQLEKALAEDILTYCNIRPQRSLLGNTPFETHSGKPIAFSNYTMHFGKQKAIRITQNNLNRCKKCIN